MFRNTFINPAGSIHIGDADQIALVIGVRGFLEERCAPFNELQAIVAQYWSETDGDRFGAFNFLGAWINELDDFLRQHPDLPFGGDILREFEQHGHLRGAGDDGTAVIHSADADAYNLLDMPLVHVVFGVGPRWFAVMHLGQGSGGPLSGEVGDETRLFENENALVLPEGQFDHHFEYHQGEWFGIGRNVQPLNQYPVSRSVADRGRGKLYWDGANAYCPLTGAVLQVRSLDRTFKRGG